jgi:hypothetical protein
MAPAKTFTGARAQLIIVDPNTNDARVMGIFNNVSVGLSYSADPIFLLGRYSADEIVYTAQDVVHVTATGWRVVNSGPHVIAKVPQLQDLLAHEYIELAILDRETGERVARISSVRPMSWAMSVANRQSVETTVTFMGLLVSDESTENAELPGASTLP